MASRQVVTLSAILLTAAGLIPLTCASARAQDASAGEPVTIVTANPAEQPSAEVAQTAQRHKIYRPRAMNDRAAKAKAALQSESAATPDPGGAQAPTIVSGLNFAGLIGGTSTTNSTPPDNEGAIGTKNYIQTINSAARIFNRTTHATIANGTLNQLAGAAPTVDSFDPQIIWDATTNRYYYAMDSIFSSTDNRITFGFSKSDSPTNLTTSWCHYAVKYGAPFPDFPKLGDSKDFILVGVNVFGAVSFTGSDIIAISKPAGTGAITTCPAATSFKKGKTVNLRDTGGNQVFTPVPSNQIDDNPTGYVVNRDGNNPATALWFFNVTKSATGTPLFGTARKATVPSYAIPANVLQSNDRFIDTSDARNTQAVQAVDPGHSSLQAFWTQHTVKNGTASAVRWYEINPAPATPTVLRTGLISQAGAFNFNAAISPDRAKKGATVKFGGSFVIQYNAASITLAPQIRARSSLNGAAISAATLVKAGVGPYLDFSCPDTFPPNNVCRWGDYAAATPDPVPTTTARGTVWGTNQFSGVVSPLTTDSNWRTQIFAIKP